MDPEQPSKVMTRQEMLDLAQFEIVRNLGQCNLTRCIEVGRAYIDFVRRRDPVTEAALLDVLGARGGSGR